MYDKGHGCWGNYVHVKSTTKFKIRHDVVFNCLLGNNKQLLYLNVAK